MTTTSHLRATSPGQDQDTVNTTKTESPTPTWTQTQKQRRPRDESEGLSEEAIIPTVHTPLKSKVKQSHAIDILRDTRIRFPLYIVLSVLYKTGHVSIKINFQNIELNGPATPVKRGPKLYSLRIQLH